jgi:Ca2+-transporting ATPase
MRYVKDELDPDAASLEPAGLSERTARQRLERDGPNELPTAKSPGISVLLKEVVSEPMVSLLIGCGALYLVLGDRQEAVMLMAFLGLIIFITLYQQKKTDTALEALRNLSSPRALVIRDRQKKRVSGREVVCGDVLIVSEGDRVPADAEILAGANVMVDESLLTGESAPVHKDVRRRNREKADEYKLFAGTTVVRGQAVARVFATAAQTEIGKIGKVLEKTHPETTRLQAETARFTKIIAAGAGMLCMLVAAAYGLSHNDWINGLLTGLTLAMAILPNELPAVLLIFLALGAWRISQRSVLTRKMPAVENLGAATVLCVDKTGTLTLNQMAVRMLYSQNGSGEEYDLLSQGALALPEKFHALVEFGILASSPSPFDPMEKAVHEVGHDYLSNTEHLHPGWRLAREYPLLPDLLAVSHVWKGDGNTEYTVGAKGAPEAIVDLCHMDQHEASRVAEKVEEFGRAGLRVLGVAKATVHTTPLPDKQHDYEFEFLGLIGFSDPVRPHVPEAIQECYRAGIRVIMITGDHANTAAAIAREIGLHNPDDIITGSALSDMDDAALSLRIGTANCFARILPDQKLRIVEVLKRRGEVVAMTGDGVNDAPALKAAQIGIAMGGRGTDVARESAALVLLDDDFSSIVDAVATGRRIFDNLCGAMAYLLSVHIPIAGISVLPVFFKLPLVLLPVHIAFLHLIIEPACSIVFEAEPMGDSTMTKAPRSPSAPLFSRFLIGPAVLQGLGVLAIVLTVFLVSLYRGQGEMDARALTFTTLIFANLGLILVNRSWSRSVLEGLRTPNPALWWVLIAGLITLSLVLYIPYARTVFRFSLLHPIDVAICLAAAFSSILWFEIWKRVQALT